MARPEARKVAMSSDPYDITGDLPEARRQAPAEPSETPAVGEQDHAHPDQARPSPIRAGAWSAGHTIDLRISIPFGFGRYYFTVVAGRERRSATRRRQDRRLHPIKTAGNITLCAGCGVIVGLAGLALIQLALSFVLQQTGSLVITP